jgi:hypothetical protein
MMLRGYIDESYNKRIFTLSCIVGTSHDWLWIESAWKKIIREKNKELRRAGRQQISRFHAADLSSCRGEFSGWSVDEQIGFAKSVLGVFHRFETVMIAYSIPIDDYKAVFPEDIANPMPNMYGLLLKFILTETVHQLIDGIEEHTLKPIHIALFHDRSDCDSEIHGAFNQMMTDTTFSHKHFFSSITPMGWENCIPLQAADLIAYEAFKDAERKLTGRARRKSLTSILESDTFGGRSASFNLKALTKLRKEMELNSLARGK